MGLLADNDSSERFPYHEACVLHKLIAHALVRRLKHQDPTKRPTAKEAVKLLDDILRVVKGPMTGPMAMTTVKDLARRIDYESSCYSYIRGGLLLLCGGGLWW